MIPKIYLSRTDLLTLLNNPQTIVEIVDDEPHSLSPEYDEKTIQARNYAEAEEYYRSDA